MMFYTFSFPIPFLYLLTFARWEVDSLLLMRTRIALFNLFSSTSSNRSVLLNMCHLFTGHVIEKKIFAPTIITTILKKCFKKQCTHPKRLYCTTSPKEHRGKLMRNQGRVHSLWSITVKKFKLWLNSIHQLS